MGFGALFYDYSPAAGRAAWQGTGLGVYPEHPSDHPGYFPGLIHAFWVQTKS